MPTDTAPKPTNSFAQWMNAETAIRSGSSTATVDSSATPESAATHPAFTETQKGLAGGGSVTGSAGGGLSASRSGGFGVTAGLAGSLRQGQPGGWASDHREETNHFTGWNYIAITAIAKQAAQAEVTVFQDAQTGNNSSADAGEKRRRHRKSLIRRFGMSKAIDLLADDQKPLPPTHPLCRLLKRPNRYQSGASFRYEIVLQLSLTGTCLIWNVPNKLGLTVERYVIPTCAANPIQPSQQFPRGAWQIIPPSQWAVPDEFGFADMPGWQHAYGAIIPAEYMQVIRWPHPARKDDGFSPLAGGALQIDTAEQIDRSRWYQLRNGPTPSLLVTPGDDADPDENELERAQTRFNQQYGGVKNAGKAIFATRGTNATPLTTTPKDMDYMSAFQQLRDFNMALHGTPGVAAGMTDSGSYAALYASITQFSRLTVQPILSLIADEETEQLAPQFGDGLVIEIEAASIDDPTLLENALRTDATAGIRTVDEFRAVRGLPPLGGEAGSKMVGGQPAAQPAMGGGASGSGGYGDGNSSGGAFGQFADFAELGGDQTATTTGISGMPGATVPGGPKSATNSAAKSATNPASQNISPRQRAIAGALQESLQLAGSPDEVRAVIKDAMRGYP